MHLVADKEPDRGRQLFNQIINPVQCTSHNYNHDGGFDDVNEIDLHIEGKS